MASPFAKLSRCHFPVFPVLRPCFVCHFLALPPHFVLCFPLASFWLRFGVPSAFILFVCSLFVFFRAYKITFQIFRFFPPGKYQFLGFCQFKHFPNSSSCFFPCLGCRGCPAALPGSLFYRLLKILFISSLSFFMVAFIALFMCAKIIKLYRCRCSHIPGQHGTPHGFGWLSFFSRVCAGGFSCGSAQFALDLKEITICLWAVIVIYGSGAATMRARLYIYFHLPVFLRLSSVIRSPFKAAPLKK